MIQIDGQFDQFGIQFADPIKKAAELEVDFDDFEKREKSNLCHPDSLFSVCFKIGMLESIITLSFLSSIIIMIKFVFLIIRNFI